MGVCHRCSRLPVLCYARQGALRLPRSLPIPPGRGRLYGQTDLLVLIPTTGNPVGVILRQEGAQQNRKRWGLCRAQLARNDGTVRIQAKPQRVGALAKAGRRGHSTLSANGRALASGCQQSNRWCPSIGGLIPPLRGGFKIFDPEKLPPRLRCTKDQQGAVTSQNGRQGGRRDCENSMRRPKKKIKITVSSADQPEPKRALNLTLIPSNTPRFIRGFGRFHRTECRCGGILERPPSDPRTNATNDTAPSSATEVRRDHHVTIMMPACIERLTSKRVMFAAAADHGRLTATDGHGC